MTSRFHLHYFSTKMHLFSWCDIFNYQPWENPLVKRDYLLIRTHGNYFNFFEKHILPSQFRCLWWWFVINSHMHGNKSQLTPFEKWINLTEYMFDTNLKRYAYLSMIVSCKFKTDFPVFSRKAVCSIAFYLS